MENNKGISLIVASFVLIYVLVLPLILFHFQIKENNKVDNEYPNEMLGAVENNKEEKMEKEAYDDGCDTTSSFLSIISPSCKNWIESKTGIDLKSKSFVIVYKFVVFWGAFIFTCVAVGIMLSPVIVFSMKCAWFEADREGRPSYIKTITFLLGQALY